MCQTPNYYLRTLNYYDQTPGPAYFLKGLALIFQGLEYI